MIEVFSESTGRIARRCRSITQAQKIAFELTEMYAWVNNEKFDWRVGENNNHNQQGGVCEVNRERAQRVNPVRHPSRIL